MNAAEAKDEARALGRTPDRWQRMFEAAEALARRRPASTILAAATFDAELLRECILQGQPAVFEALPSDWKCTQRDGPSLECAIGDLPCPDTGLGCRTLGEWLQALRSGTPRWTGGYAVSQELQQWSGLPANTGAVHWGQIHLFGGPAGALTPLHRDAGDGLNIHLLGSKHWTLLSPLHWRLLLPDAGAAAGGFQESDVGLAPFALTNSCAAPPPLVRVVRPGQAIFVPSGWFHEVKLLEPALSLAAPLHLNE